MTMETDIIDAALEKAESVLETDVTENEDAASGSNAPADTSSKTDASESDDSAPETDAAPETDSAPEDSEGESDQESSVSGNSAGESGSSSTIVFPEGFEYSGMSPEDAAALVESVEYQTGVIYGGFLGMSIFLGFIAGILIIHGFRLRRV